MKKLLNLLLVLVLCLTISGCEEKEVENPVIKYETLEAANIKAGVTLVKPAVSGVKDDYIGIVDNNTAVYRFILNGYEYYERGCRNTSIDMSGLFTDKGGLFDDYLDEKECYGEAEGYKAIRFILGKTQYIFGVLDEGKMDKESFYKQYQEIRNQIIYDSSTSDGRSYVGTWIDTISQRATATITLGDVNTFKIVIHWASSANTYDEFVINTNYAELTYNDIVHTENTVNEDGTVTSVTLDDSIPGKFVREGETLIWAPENFNFRCEFVMLDE